MQDKAQHGDSPKLSASHTPGPWKIYPADGLTIRGVYGEGKMICSLLPALYRNKKNTRQEIEANANLIAAAPDMYNALKAVSGRCTPEMQIIVDAAIAKANGDQS